MNLEKKIELLEEILLEVLVDVNHAEDGAYTPHIKCLEQMRWDLLKEKTQRETISNLASDRWAKSISALLN